MISFPLYYILFPIGALYLIWFVSGFFSIMHVVKFGYINYISYLMTFLYLGLSIITLFLVYSNLSSVDWYELIKIELY